MPDSEQNIVLSIAGFDPCAGAGLLADMQTLQQCKVQGMSVQTALTIQNEDEVKEVFWHPLKGIIAQLDTLLSKYEFEVVKIGVTQNLETLSVIVEHLRAHNPTIIIIWDPVITATSGFQFLEKLDAQLLKKVIEQIHLITPNLSEFEVLTRTLKEEQLPTHVLLKGGHTDGNDTSDQLISLDGTTTQIIGQRIDGKSKHGTGCVLSSAIAAGLSKGMKLKTACTFAKRYIEGYLKSGVNKLGAHYTIEI
ncbi:hydroxymethylpyrimidine/phosphomethylpyrimidine kinase [Reichenbachiella sp.]|uniref:hydroxymethylpyrimidine/phosphomethylpyrimidine kinase n=1 Tax=Reichenbachiella sp. TaxID=2184521 RepID=UPI003BB17C5D